MAPRPGIRLSLPTVAANRKLSEAISMSQAADESCMVALETYACGLVESTRGHLTKAGTAYRRGLASLAERGEDDAPVEGLSIWAWASFCACGMTSLRPCPQY